jgi:hypothetical protein
LPGGDPLAAALAAGETPSPAMVAASGEKEGLRPAIAWACLALAILGLVAMALLSNNTTVINMVPMPMSAEVLAAKARDLTRTLGYAAPVDTSYAFGRSPGYLSYIKDRDQSKNRWEQLKSGFPPVVVFWYRESPQYMANKLFTWVAIAEPDAPPLQLSGMVQDFFSPDGRLIEFTAVPPQLDTSTDPAPAPDWGPLFAAAGLDAKDFHATPPQWTPLVTSDARQAWLGTWPGHPDLPLRVEAAAFRGKVVFFDLYAPWDKPDRMQEDPRTTPEKVRSGIAIGLFCFVIVLGIILARGNVRAGRSDWKGAARLALFCFVLTMAAMIFFTHHVPTAAELELLLMMAGWSLVGTSLVWLLYVALEPHVRKRWPASLVSWSRLLAGARRAGRGVDRCFLGHNFARREFGPWMDGENAARARQFARLYYYGRNPLHHWRHFVERHALFVWVAGAVFHFLPDAAGAAQGMADYHRDGRVAIDPVGI